MVFYSQSVMVLSMHSRGIVSRMSQRLLLVDVHGNQIKQTGFITAYILKATSWNKKL